MARKRKLTRVEGPPVGTELFVAGAVQKTKGIKVGAAVIPIELNWADGMVGVLPVFKDLESAAKFIGDNQIQVFSITTVAGVRL